MDRPPNRYPYFADRIVGSFANVPHNVFEEGVDAGRQWGQDEVLEIALEIDRYAEWEGCCTGCGERDGRPHLDWCPWPMIDAYYLLKGKQRCPDFEAGVDEWRRNIRRLLAAKYPDALL